MKPSLAGNVTELPNQVPTGQAANTRVKLGTFVWQPTAATRPRLNSAETRAAVKSDSARAWRSAGRAGRIVD